ncbi:hypothetical protein OAT07_02260 [Candidatus Pelagibacter sp.]|nr:hypothetical protein [Candidatus Pelagibacter sp.]
MISLILTNCSLNKNSKFWTEDNIKKISFQKEMNKILKKTNNPLLMTFNEYEIFLNEYVKDNNYPDINK